MPWPAPTDGETVEISFRNEVTGEERRFALDVQPLPTAECMIGALSENAGRSVTPPPGFRLSAMRKRSGARRRWRWRAAYVDPPDGKAFSGHVEAADKAEAGFAASWRMALDAGARPDDLPSFLRAMEDIEILECRPDPITREEAVDLLRRVASPETVGEGRRAVAEARRRLRRLGNPD